jgi:hypothetical protein
MALARLPGPSRLMLRSLLADRFKLTLHHDTRTPGLCAAIARRDGTFPGADYAPNFATVDFSSKTLTPEGLSGTPGAVPQRPTLR